MQRNPAAGSRLTRRRILPARAVEACDSEANGPGRNARAALEELAREGTPVRYVRTTFLRDDETCFHVLEAAAGEVCRRAGMAPDGSSRPWSEFPRPASTARPPRRMGGAAGAPERPTERAQA
jgi:hypothetical protein